MIDRDNPTWHFLRHDLPGIVPLMQRAEELLRVEYSKLNELAQAAARIREILRQEKQYVLADELRQVIEAAGFTVEDGIVNGQPMPPRVYRTER